MAESENDFEKYLKLLIHLYLFHKNMKIKIKQNLIGSKKESYYIIKGKWSKKLMDYFDYEELDSFLNQDNSNSIINKYGNNKNVKEILKSLPNKYVEKMKAKVKNKNEIDKLKKEQNYQLSKKNRIIMSYEATYYYYPNIDIFDDDIYNIIKHLIKLDNEEKIEFLIGDEKIIMNFTFSSQKSLIIGNYIDFSFNTDIILDLMLDKYIKYFIENFLKKGYSKTMIDINTEENEIVLLSIDQNTRMGYAYNLHMLEGVQKNNIQKNNLPPKQEKESSNKRNPTFDSNQIGSNNKKIEEKKNSSINKIDEKNKLNNFMKNQIKSLILYYYFLQDLEKNIKSSTNTNQTYKQDKCYLIDEIWMNLYLVYFSYQDLIKDIKKKQEQYLIKEEIEKIFDNLDIKLIEQLKLKEKDKPEIKFSYNEKENEGFIELDKQQNILGYLHKFDILNTEIYEKMNESPERILKYLKQRDYLINDGYIIIKFEETLELYIGTYNFEYHKFEPEILFRYNSKEFMNNHFDNLKKFTFKIFKLYHTSKNRNELTLLRNDQANHKTAGQIFELRYIKSKQPNSNLAENNDKNIIQKNVDKKGVQNNKKVDKNKNHEKYRNDIPSKIQQNNDSNSNNLKDKNIYIKKIIINSGEKNTKEQNPKKNENNIKEIENRKNIEISEKKKNVDNFICIMIDLKRIFFKINTPFNNSSAYEKYYILNLDWFENYLQNTQLNYLFNNIIMNNKIEEAINNSNSTNKDILKILQLDNDCIKEINNMYDKFKKISSIPISTEPKELKINQVHGFYNFILLSEEAINNLFGNISGKSSLNCFLGDGMVLFLFNKEKKVELYKINDNKYILYMVLDFKDSISLNESIKLLKENKFEKYNKYFLMFNNDYVSPIFNMNNKEIGTAILYHPQILDYSKYFISEKLKAFVKLYFNYLYLHSTNNNQRDGKYVLINPELIDACKNHYKYKLLETKLNGNSMAQQVIANFQNQNRKMYDILTDKIIFGIIKYHLLEINQQFFKVNNFININNIKQEPKSQEFEGNNFSYYQNFELIDEDIYKILFNKNDYLFRECYFEIICIFIYQEIYMIIKFQDMKKYVI